MKKTRILIVDDKEENLYLLRTLLQGHGFEVAEARHGAEALEVARRNPPDLIVADILMPVMDGFSLCREWKQDERLKRIPFVFYTATYTDEKDRDFALGLGAEHFIVKPEDPDALLETLRATLRKAGSAPPSGAPAEGEPAFLKQYSEALVRKLEAKMEQLREDIARRQEVEAKLRASEDQFRELFRHMASGVAVFEASADGSDFKFKDINQAGLAIVEMDRASVIGQPVEAVLPSVRGMGLLDMARRVWKTGVAEGHPAARYADGLRTFWYESHAYKLPSGEVVVVFEDVTARKQAEDALRKSEECFRSFVENAQDIVFSMSPGGVFLYVSPNWKEILGHDLRDVVGQSLAAFVHPDDLASCRAAMEQAMATGRRQEVPEYRVRHRNGTWRWHMSNGKFVRPPGGGSAAFLGIARDITERRQAEDALRESEERFRLLVKNSSDIIGILNLDGSQRYVSSAAETITGFSAEELQRRTVADVVHPDDLPRVQAALRECLAHPEKPHFVRYRHVHKSRGWVPVEAVGQSAMDEQSVKGVVISVRDISERMQAEAALRESEERFRLLVKNSTDIICIIEPDYTQRFVSPSVERITGFSAEELQQKTIVDVVHPDDISRARATFEQAIAHPDQIFAARYRHIHKTRGWVHLEAIGQSALDVPSVHGVILSVRDISERVRAEEERMESQARFAELFNANPTGLVLVDRTTRVIAQINPAAAAMVGLPPDQIVGQVCNGFICPADIASCPVCDLGQAIDRSERVLVRADGARLPILKTVVPVALDGKPFLLESFIDLSGQKAAEEERERLQTQLNQAQKMESVGRLAGGVAHDFNNMLGVILGHVELALQDAPPDHPLCKNLAEIQKAAEHSAGLTRQLLAFARKQTVAPQVLDLNATVEASLQMLRRLIGEEIRLTWLPAKHLAPVKMDPTQIDQILTNLCVNARDAIGGQGQIRIETGTATLDEARCADHAGVAPGEYVRLAVSDTGCGMDPETLAHLFEPFFTTKDVGQGTGLGLATVYGIVKQNNGFIDVRSEPGRGTTFGIHLPRHQDKKGQIQMLVPPASPAARGQETILLVEDEPAILGVGKTMLERLGYRVLGAATPGEALRLAEAHPGEIHLLMTDVIMPEMNGRDLAKNLLDLYPRLRRLFMSGYTADVIAHHGVLDDGMHFIQKPFTMKVLSEKVREALDRKP